MQKVCVWVLAAVCCGAAALAAPTAADLKVDKYQVTGPVVELTDAKIVIQKDDGKWEIARDAATAVTGELKVGAKVTIKYKMIAASVEVKAAKDGAAKAPKAAAKASSM